MEQERRTVTLSLAEYAELLDDSMRYSILYRGILSKASLNYNETGLMFQDGDIDLILKLIQITLLIFMQLFLTSNQGKQNISTLMISKQI